MWNLTCFLTETLLVSVQDSCTVCAKCTISLEIVLDTMMVRVKAQVDASFSLFADSAKLDADRCTVCAERTIGSEIILDAPDGTPR